MKKDLSKILSKLRSMLPYLRKTYNIKEIAVFGSYIRKEQKATSDLDLLVSFSKVPGLLEFIRLENELSDRLGIKVDLVMKDLLKPALKPFILNSTVSV